MAVVSVAIILSFHLKSQPTPLERRIALPLGLVFWLLALSCVGLGTLNYAQCIRGYAKRRALVQTGIGTQVVCFTFPHSRPSCCQSMIRRRGMYRSLQSTPPRLLSLLICSVVVASMPICSPLRWSSSSRRPAAPPLCGYVLSLAVLHRCLHRDRRIVRAVSGHEHAVVEIDRPEEAVWPRAPHAASWGLGLDTADERPSSLPGPVVRSLDSCRAVSSFAYAPHISALYIGRAEAYWLRDISIAGARVLAPYWITERASLS